MLGWIVFVVAYLVLALLWSLGIRRVWRKPPYIDTDNGYNSANVRAFQRAVVPFSVGCFAAVAMVAVGHAADESHGPAAVVFSCVSATFCMLTLVAVIFIGTVRSFNWPKVLVHPGSREDPGTVDEREMEWLSRRGHR